MMADEKNEVHTEIDVAAEIAYRQLIEESKQNSQLDNEFDYDENELSSIGKKLDTEVIEKKKEHVFSGNEAAKTEDMLINKDIANAETDTSSLEGNKYSIVSEAHASLNIVDDQSCVKEVIQVSSDSKAAIEPTVVLKNDTAPIEIKESSSEGDSDFEKATEEWNQVEEIDLTKQDTVHGGTSNDTDLITFTEALEHFDSLQVSDYTERIRPCVKHTGLASVWHSITGPPKLSKNLNGQRNLIFTLAVVTFDNANKIHLQILQTFYKILTKRQTDCPRFGGHWEAIGFQGDDPSTDLRGCGMLGLLTTLHFITMSRTSKLAASIYHLSRDEIQNFPFCVMSINVTRIALQILREGKLNKECNKRMKEKSRKYRNEFDAIVFDIFQELYVSIFNKIYLTWKNEGKTMVESGFVIKDVEEFSKKKPTELMKNFRASVTTSKTPKGEKIDSFVGIENL